ncbi:MAG: hypothetical protein ACFFBS_02905 [Promethearchaeota archaeon]
MQLTLDTAVWYIVAIAVVLAALYISVRLVAGRKTTDAPFLLRLLVVAVIAVFAIPALSTIASRLSIPQLAPIIAFIVLIYSVRYIVEIQKGQNISHSHAIWISFMCLLIILILNLVTTTFLGVTIVEI